jgi:NADH dehydrogenase
VAGGGFAGVETAAGTYDFVLEALPFYPHVSEELIRMVLVHPGTHLLPELGEKLGSYASRVLERRGIEVRLQTRVKAVTASGVELSNGEYIATNTVVWTAGSSAHPLLETLPLRKDKGRLVTDEFLGVAGTPGLWAIGDCALIPDRARGGYFPPTAQHALREGRVLARNLVSAVEGRPLKPFVFTTLGQLAAIGKRRGVARVFGLNFSGFFAWWLWRTIYLAKLPRFEKKLRVALDWTLDLVFSKDLVQLQTPRSRGLSSTVEELREVKTA